ncbi:iron ABC transporter permease [Streptococcus chenjunshii]|uniref:Iron ABC transporter permease n=1 Tax=Streptococcus chenjunshii TaxID=2173853 RepID=A0A372KMY0_9STRE|nr:iron ABC transporter permease [Streptococcus chenjunshii]AXQ79185.1 iron ABC transporter permease [Streptococcus chenjunshii]RFU50756.1 iron ABC transporter permease [Streptococcus chenjunshii]RFU52938.1 iron ABC transporter permease [Streptococcus chenjunshii]
MSNDKKFLKQAGRLKTPWLAAGILLLLFILGWYAALRFGALKYSHAQLIEVFRHPLTDSREQDVIIDLRLPRTFAAILVGAAMAQAGAIMQGVTRNPIADPGLLGINAGSGLALIIGYAVFDNMHYMRLLVICLFGAFAAAFLVFGLSYQKGKGYNQLRLILAGAMVSTLFSAIGQAVTIYFNLSTAVIGWQAGGLVQINWKMLAIIAPFIISGFILAQLLAHQLTILSLNETVAKSLGQRTFAVTVALLGIVLLMSAGAVALVGSVSFIGLIIPHFIRMFAPKSYRILLPLTAFAGATFMLWVDIICRNLNPPAETPISAIISIIGLPCFLWLIRRGSNL